MKTQPLTARRTIVVTASLLIMLAMVSLVSLSIGSVPVPASHVFGALVGSDGIPDAERLIITDLRLPRVVLAIVVGAGLSVAGLVFQALLRNPLAEPYILGISSGGTVGAVMAMSASTGSTLLTTPLASFAGSSGVMLLVYGLAHRRGRLDPSTLLLSGVMIGAFFNALLLLIVAVFSQETRSAFLWLMGNLSTATLPAVAVIGPPVLLVSFLLFWYAKGFNLIATGEEAALQLGVNVPFLKKASYLLASLITGLVVSVSGVVGFVGLIIPHICRMLFGPDHRLLLPASFLLGAIFLVGADLLARTVIAPTEIPVGAVTAAIGAPVFIYLLRKV
ncbi:MAG: iron ABC transporter permease [Bacteroidota bacterium]